MVKAFTPWGVEVNFYTLWCNGQHCKEYPNAQNVYFYTWQCKRPLFLLTFSPRGVKVNKDCDLLHRQVQKDT